MKKSILLTAVLAVVIIACHKKGVPTVADRTVQPEPPASPTAPVVAAHTAADLEAGKVIYETKCIRCHAAKPVETYTAERWAGILRSMIPKARLDSAQKMQVTAYVNTNAKKA